MLLRTATSSAYPWPDRYENLPVEPADVDRWAPMLDGIALSDTEKRLLMGVLSNGIDGFKTRAALMDAVPTMVADQKPECLAEAQAFRGRFTSGSLFGLAPIEEVLLVYLHGSRLVNPTLRLDKALVPFVQNGFEKLASQPVFAGCENSPQIFIDLVTSTGAKIFFNKGHAHHAQLTPNASRIRYED